MRTTVVSDLVTHRAFLVSGSTALVVLLVAVALTRVTQRPFAGSALALSTGFLAGLVATTGSPALLVVGLVPLAACGRAWARGGTRWVAHAAGLLLVGAVLVGVGSLDAPAWARLAGVGAVVLGGPLVATSNRALGDLAAPLLAVSAVGAYATLPDTEQAVALVGAGAATAVGGWAARRGCMSDAGSLVTTGLLVWVVGAGATDDAAAMARGLGCLGVLLVASLSWSSETAPPAGWRAVAATGHLLVVAVSARLLLRLDDVVGAMAVEGATLGVAGAALRALAVRARPGT